MMLLGFISLLLTATSSSISHICIPSKFYDSTFSPCSKAEIDEETEDNASSEGRKLLMRYLFPHTFRRTLNELTKNTCGEVCHMDFIVQSFTSLFSISFYCCCYYPVNRKFRGRLICTS